jgi:hypothetical protein
MSLVTGMNNGQSYQEEAEGSFDNIKPCINANYRISYILVNRS